MICAKTGWNWPSGSGQEDKNAKSLQQQQRQCGKQRRQRTTNFDWKSSLELEAQVSL